MFPKTALISITLLFSLFTACIYSNSPGKKLLPDDMEQYPLYKQSWSVSGGPEVSSHYDDEISHSGKHSLRWTLNIDHKKGANEKYPVGWLFLNKKTAKQDWSGYNALEFYLYIPKDQKITKLKYAIQTKGSKPVWLDVPLQNVIPGKWCRIILPVNGKLKEAEQIRFYIAEKWYDDNTKLDIYIDDIRLLKTASAPEMQKLRPASYTVKIPEAYKKIKTARIYPAVPLEFIYPDTDISTRKPLKKIFVRAAKGEVKNITFVLLAGDKDIKDLSLKVSDLKTKENSIPEKDIDIRVVKIWKQASLHWEIKDRKYQVSSLVKKQNEEITVPELLVKDDRIKLSDKREKNGAYQPPSVLKYDIGTDIPAHSLKQIWITIRIPADIDPGIYKGILSLSAQKGMKKTVLPLDIEVLPFVLPEPELYYGIYYRWRSNPDEKPGMYLPENLIYKDMEELRETGFNGISIHDNSLSGIEKKLALLKKLKFKGPIVFLLKDNKDIEKIIKLSRAYNFKPFFYGVDEPENEEKLQKHIIKSEEIHKMGGKVITAISYNTLLKLNKKGIKLDWANFSTPTSYINQLISGKIKRPDIFQTYYWQLYQENPTLNRFSAGFLLWNSGMNGVFPYEYQGFPKGLAYADEKRYSHKKRTTPQGDVDAGTRIFRAWCVTYPSREGPVSTLQWEGIREGINDVRYLTYLHNILERMRKQGKKEEVKRTESKLKEILRPFNRVPSYGFCPNKNPYIDPSAFEKARARIIELIMENIKLNN